MNILHIVPALESGGVETGTVDLALSLGKLGQKVVVISSGGRLVGELEGAGIEHIRLPVHRKSPFSLFLAPRVASVIKERKIDIVHASSRVPAWIGFLACKLTHTHFVTSCHGYYSKHFFSSVMARGELVMVISESVGERMKDAFGVPEEKIRLVYRGVNLERYPYDANKYEKDKRPFKIINIGRLTPLKGQREFIRAMEYVREKRQDVEAWIAGGPEKGKENYSRELRRLAEETGLKEHVKFLGLRSDIPQLLKQADLLVLSSAVPEGFGRVVIEAGAAGTAVCASNVGGIKEIIDDGVTGLLFPPRNALNMADAIMKMLGDIGLRKKCAENLRKKVERFFTLERMAEETLSVYKEVIAR